MPRKVLLITSALLGFYALLKAIELQYKYNKLWLEILEKAKNEGIEPTAIAGNIKTNLLISLIPLLAIVLTAFVLKKQKGAGWVLIFNVLVFLYCILSGFATPHFY